MILAYFYVPEMKGRSYREIDILFNGVRKGKGKLIVSDNALSVKVSTTNFQGGNGNGKLL